VVVATDTTATPYSRGVYKSMCHFMEKRVGGRFFPSALRASLIAFGLAQGIPHHGLLMTCISLLYLTLNMRKTTATPHKKTTISLSSHI
jgi:hypothetical protein